MPLLPDEVETLEAPIVAQDAASRITGSPEGWQLCWVGIILTCRVFPASFIFWPRINPQTDRARPPIGTVVNGSCEKARNLQGGEAAAGFQKILDHLGVVVNEPIGALAHLGLARAYAMQGDTVKARTAYQDFLTLWKDADPDIPVLIATKAEYAKLQ